MRPTTTRGTSRKRQPLSWTPRRRGKTFCSPACGRGCTTEEHLEAWRHGRDLVKTLGPGWRPRVWENFGWHFNAVSSCGRWKVHGEGESYTAFLGDKGSSGGYWAESGKTPQEAIAKTWKVAQASWRPFLDAGQVLR